VPGGVWYEHHVIAGNYRLGEFQGAVLNAQLDRLDEQADTRDATGAISPRGWRPAGVHPQARPDDCTRHAYHLFMLRLDPSRFGAPRDAVLRALQAEGIPCSSGYGFSLPEQPLFRHKAFGPYLAGTRDGLDYGAVHCPNSDLICREQGVWLEHRLLLGTRDDMDDVARAFEKVHEHRNAWVGGGGPVSRAAGLLKRRVVPALTALSENTYLSAVRAGWSRSSPSRSSAGCS
jgi:dTDP-4-amino-4,6-dideoxygalactose transaminase